MSDQNQSGTSFALSAFLHAAMLVLFMMINPDGSVCKTHTTTRLLLASG